MAKVYEPTDLAVELLRKRLESRTSQSSIKLSEEKATPGCVCYDHGIWTEFAALKNDKIKVGRSYNMQLGDRYPPFSKGLPVWQHYIHTNLMHNENALTPPEYTY